LSRHEYDYEDELDDGLGIASRTHISKKAWIDSMERETERKKNQMITRDLFSGIRKYIWRASLPGGAAVEGQIMIPETGSHADVVTMKAFDIVFSAVKLQYEGLGQFEATIEGRLLGRFRVPEPRIEVDAFGRPRRYYGDRVIEKEGMDWLRNNMEFRLSDGRETFPPYEPALPGKSKGVPVTQAAQNWSQKLATAKPKVKPEDVWTPLNEGQNMAAIGVNLSATSGSGATNLAFATQLEQTRSAGQSATAKDRAAKVVQMHLEGKVIG
jgi:hypothetical protein